MKLLALNLAKLMCAAASLLLSVALFPFTLVESAVVLLTLALMFVVPDFALGLRSRVAAVAGRLARRKRLAVLVCGLLPLLLRAALLPLMPIPDPLIHDEFSYLLAADTFAAGRLANPTHPLWPYFEAPHVNQKPTYGSKYPPAQGIAMAVGQVVLGHPWYGVWLSVGLMCAAACWSMQQWLPARWALFGGVLLGLRLGVAGYWMNSYWGGAAAAIGGALVIGAFARIRRRPQWPDGLLLGAGLCVLANSRPFEGLLTALPLAVYLALDLVRKSGPHRIEWLKRAALPVCLACSAGLAAMAYYNARTTGDPLKLPYQVNREQYGVTPLVFAFGQDLPPEPSYQQASVREFYAGWEVDKFNTMQSWPGLVRRRIDQALRAWQFFGGPLFALPLLLVTWVVRDRRLRVPVVVLALFLFTLLFVVWILPHYLAPVLAAAWILAIQATRHLYHWSNMTRRTGRFYVHAMPVVAVLSLAACVVQSQSAEQPRTLYSETSPCVCWGEQAMIVRARLARKLERSGGKHLVLVRYGPAHNVHEEWVYNKAAIDDAAVVWAHGDAPQNVVRYFSDRTIWVLDADRRPAELEAYSDNHNTAERPADR